ncbi:MAG: glycosyltransferase family 2 protein [Candidatus Omnitrophota bacterium]
MTVIFWVLAGLIIYTYFGYPLTLIIASKLTKKKIEKKEIFPSVSIIIAAHNEEKSIKEKLKNTIALDYPKEKLEIIVASDASTDRTNEFVRDFKDQGVKLISFKERLGKTFVQNEAVTKAGGEILLFSDATTIYEKRLLKKILSNFADPSVGGVGGELAYVNKSNSLVGRTGEIYWEYEKFLKKRENLITSLIGVSGCCYAVRKQLYEPIKSDIISDFVIAQMIYKKGKRVVYEPEAISYETGNTNPKEEFKMRVRVATRTIHGIWYMRFLLNPFKYGFFAMQLLSHKVLRYLIPIFLLGLFLVNIALFLSRPELIYKLSLFLQISFYLSAFTGWFLKAKNRVLYVPFYFCITNFALLTGLLEFLRGEKQVAWKPLR